VTIASVTGAVGSVTGNVGGNVGGNVTGSVGSVATGGIAASSFAAGAIDAAAIATDAIDADAIKADAVTEIQSGLATAANLATVAGYIDTEVAAIKAKTDNLPASPAATGDIPSAATIADAVWDEAIAGHVAAGSTGEALSSAGSAGDPWATALPGAYSAGTAGKIIGDNVNATISSRASSATLGSPAGASIAADIAAVQADTDNLQTRVPAALVSGRMDSSVGAMAANVMTAAAAASDLTTELQSGLATAADLATVDTVVDAIKLKTDNLPSDPADQSAVEAAIAALLTGNMTEAYGASGAPVSVAKALYMILAILSNRDIVGTTLTARKLDGSTAAATFTLDSGSAPTSQVRAT
jgi:hypothetical protein